MAVTEPSSEPSLAYAQAMAGAEPAAPRCTPGEAFAAARRHFLAGERLDMVALAAELGVARATLYRWTGGREQLLSDVICAELTGIARYAIDRSTHQGIERLLEVVDAFMTVLAAAPALQQLLQNEGDGGLRLVTAPTGPVRPRLVAMLAALIEDEVAAGHYRPPAPTRLLADGIVALGERHLHNGGDPAAQPDPAGARAIVALLLREDPA